jgi:hypothetical protein
MANSQGVSDENVGTPKKGAAKQVRFDEGLFAAGVIGALKTHSNITDDTAPITIAAATDEITELWLIKHDGEVHGGFDNALEALQDITQYIVDSGYVYEIPINYEVDTFTVSLSLPTKTAGATLILARHCHATQEDLGLAMLDACNDLQRFAVESFKVTGATRQPPSGFDDAKKEDEPFEFSTLRISIYNNKLVARLIPVAGSWVQHGVPLYPDVAKKAGINLADYAQPGDYELAGAGVISYKQDGKPMRAHSVELS